MKPHPYRDFLASRERLGRRARTLGETYSHEMAEADDAACNGDISRADAKERMKDAVRGFARGLLDEIGRAVAHTAKRLQSEMKP